jgi:predicted MPP superfamily phosphohydrolase
LNRRTFIKTLIGASFSLLVPSSIGYYAYGEAPFQWQFRKLELKFRQLPKALHGLRIMHFSDTHFGFHFDQIHFRPIIEMMIAQKPDMYIFTGDLFYPDCRELAEIKSLFTSLRAPLGQYAVAGNHDYVYGLETIRTFLSDAGFRFLNNEAMMIEQGEFKLRLMGVDDHTFGNPEITDQMSKVGLDNIAHERPFTLLLSHAPDFADQARATAAIDLQLSGHSHGGQVRLPLIGHLIAPKHGRKYPDGHYSWPNERMQLFTNRGIGTSRLPIRLLCPPEINLIVLQNDEKR